MLNCRLSRSAIVLISNGIFGLLASSALADVVVRVSAEPSNGGAIVRFEAEVDGSVAEVGSAFVDRSGVIPDTASAAAPDKYDETITAMDAVAERKLVEIHKRIQLKIAEPYRGKYPTCSEASAAERSAGGTVELQPGADFPGADADGKLCLIVPRNKIFAHNPFGQLQAMMEAPVIAEFETQRDFGVSRQKKPQFDGGIFQLRPFYSGAAAGAAADLLEIAKLVRKAAPDASIRQWITAVSRPVQSLETIPVLHAGGAVGTPFPSAAALLMDGRGTDDAKATVIAGLVLGLDPSTRIALFEIGDSYVLGVGVPITEGDLTIENPVAEGKDPKLLVALDPRSVMPLGRIRNPAIERLFADGVLRKGEVDMFHPITDIMEALHMPPFDPE